MSSPFEDEYRRTAASIERDNPLWIVIWGIFSREYWAFPKFNVPPHTILHARNPSQLAAQMRQVEREYLGAPAPQHHDIKRPPPGGIKPVNKRPPS